jgi:hypothetical protein
MGGNAPPLLSSHSLTYGPTCPPCSCYPSLCIFSVSGRRTFATLLVELEPRRCARQARVLMAALNGRTSAAAANPVLATYLHLLASPVLVVHWPTEESSLDGKMNVSLIQSSSITTRHPFVSAGDDHKCGIAGWLGSPNTAGPGASMPTRHNVRPGNRGIQLAYFNFHLLKKFIMASWFMPTSAIHPSASPLAVV